MISIIRLIQRFFTSLLSMTDRLIKDNEILEDSIKVFNAVYPSKSPKRNNIIREIWRLWARYEKRR